MNFEEIQIYNPGILISTMPNDVYADLLDSSNKQIANKSISKALKRSMFTDLYVQGIEESFYVTCPNSYNQYISEFAIEYAKHFKLNIGNNPSPKIVQNWINLQKKHEYRPLHQHGGMALSFVTYIKIPYDLNEEDKQPNYTSKALKFRNGRIEFMYNLFDGQQRTMTVDIDQTFEGKTLIFYNSLFHIVYPFYSSDDYRISISGNVTL